MRADADLPWYFGTGASTRQGDAGLRSPLGAQLDLMRTKQLCDGRAVDASALEDAMIDRLGDADLLRHIEGRLRSLSVGQVEILRLHYDTGSLPFTIDQAAAVLPVCIAWTRPGGPFPQNLRGALHAASERQRAEIRADSDALVKAAIAAYERGGR